MTQLALFDLEAESRKLPVERRVAVDSTFHPIRRLLCDVLLDLLQVEHPKKKTLESVLEIARRQHGPVRRNAALLLLRFSGEPGVVPDTHDLALVSLSLEAIPDICRASHVEAKKQTFENAALLRQVHATFCSQFRFLTQSQDVASAAQEVVRALGGRAALAYSAPYDSKTLLQTVGRLTEEFRSVQAITDSTYERRVNALVASIDSEDRAMQKARSFVADVVGMPFLAVLRGAVAQLNSTSHTRFRCEITSMGGAPDFPLEKRYSLVNNRASRLLIPLTNSGPGTAKSVHVSIAAPDTVLVLVPDLNLGDIPPGPFSVGCELLAGADLDEVTLALTIRWSSIAATDFKNGHFSVRVLAQSRNVDWGRLRSLRPYNTNPAEGAEFVGRREKVSTLSARLLQDPIQSSYITGQKRVGKSSLALAVRDAVTSQSGATKSLYLEYGEIADTDPSQTLRNLGQRIAEYMTSFLPEGQEVSFTGTSLAPSRALPTVFSRTVRRVVS